MVWKRAMGLMILKPNKKKLDPGSFRPISLLCNLGKVLESIVTTRLYSWAESTNLLPSEQSGFRKKRSVNDILFQLTQIIAEQFAKRRTQRLGLGLEAISLDLEKVFDRGWHNGLRFKLLNLNLPPLLGGFQIFLRIGWCRHISWVPHPGTSPSITVYHKVVP